MPAQLYNNLQNDGVDAVYVLLAVTAVYPAGAAAVRAGFPARAFRQHGAASLEAGALLALTHRQPDRLQQRFNLQRPGEEAP